ncbi:MAG: 30S ribosome-binding factor RbfA [Pseudomonadota bacterium]|nr:30S ribosome-binding factor RbfA [Pseudomonadota bacterium]
MSNKNLLNKGTISQRQIRVQELLRSAINEILQRGETQNRVLDDNPITITFVDVSPDLKNAKFLFIPMNNNNIKDYIEGFNSAKKRIRKKIAERIKLKFVPEISFHYDDSIKDIERIEKILASEKVSKDINK